MAAVLMSNPGGLPLAVLGNPRRRKARMARRTVRFFVSRSRRRNPNYEFAVRSPGGALQSGSHVTNRRGLDKFLSTKFPGYEVVSIRSLGAARKRKSIRRARKSSARRVVRRSTRRRASITHRRPHRKQRGRRSRKKAAMARRRRARRRVRGVVGRTYRRRGRGFVRVFRASVRRRRGRRIKHPAVGWSGRRGKVVFAGIGNRRGKRRHLLHTVRFTNPRRRRRGRRVRRNPGGAVGAYIGGLTSAPGRVLSSLRGKGMVKNALWLGGGTVATYLAGGMLLKFASPYLAKIPGLDKIMANDTAKRVIGAAVPYTMAFVATKLLRKQLGSLSGPILLGGAAASLISLLFPKAISDGLEKLGLAKVAGVSGLSLCGPTEALAGYFGSDVLAGYVEAPSYSGVQGYVEAPSYSGVGQEALAGYVEAPSYAGVGQEALAGYLDESTDNALKSFLDG